MNTRLNLLKDKKAELELKNENITLERINSQSVKCGDKFDKWQRCIKMKSWNDEECVGQLKPKYEYCILKRNLMQTIFDDKLDE